MSQKRTEAASPERAFSSHISASLRGFDDAPAVHRVRRAWPLYHPLTDPLTVTCRNILLFCSLLLFKKTLPNKRLAIKMSEI